MPLRLCAEDRQRLKAASQSAFVSESFHYFFPPQQDGETPAGAAAGCLLSRTLITTTPCLHLPAAAAAATATAAAAPGSWYWVQCTLLPGTLEGRALHHPISAKWLLLLPPAAAAAAAATAAAGEDASGETGASAAAAAAAAMQAAAAAASEEGTDVWTAVSAAFVASFFHHVAFQVYGQFADGWAAACRLDEEPQDRQQQEQQQQQQQQQQQEGFAWEDVGSAFMFSCCCCFFSSLCLAVSFRVYIRLLLVSLLLLLLSLRGFARR